ncbi:hypothetical protein [Arcanobacterium ihumii]|nr:hypothetical protein [Arcanobacterium ihumii]
MARVNMRDLNDACDVVSDFPPASWDNKTYSGARVMRTDERKLQPILD